VRVFSFMQCVSFPSVSFPSYEEQKQALPGGEGSASTGEQELSVTRDTARNVAGQSRLLQIL
jgi:hypothetical protein